MKCMLLNLCVISFVFGSGNDILTQECLKNYLKNRGVEEEILSYVNGFIGSISDCESAVKTNLAYINDNLRHRLMSDRKNRPFVECVMKDIEEEDDDVSYENVVLLEKTIDMISNWRFWKYWAKSSRLDALREEAENIVEKSLIKCKGHREYGDLFTNINEKNIEWARSGEEECCIRKVLVEKGLLNHLLYNFKENPRNVRTDSLDCAKIFQDVTDHFYDSLKNTKNINDCFMNVYRKNGYAENILKAEVLSKLMLTRSDKSKERQNFINNMVDITYDTRRC